MTSLATGFLIPKLEKKRILLIATYATKRDLRARVLRKLGVEVDCAADIGEARSLWRGENYYLGVGGVGEEFCDKGEIFFFVKKAKTTQKERNFCWKTKEFAPL